MALFYRRSNSQSSAASSRWPVLRTRKYGFALRDVADEFKSDTFGIVGAPEVRTRQLVERIAALTHLIPAA
jgi:hypothetical protein